MNPHDKYRLRTNRMELVENINPVDPLLDYLIGKEIIAPDMAEDILAESTNQDKVARLLNMLEKRGPLAYFHFRDSLRQEEVHGHLVQLLDNTDITKMPQKSGKDETDARPFSSSGSAKREPKSEPFTHTASTAGAVPPQTARIHNPNAQGRGATGTARTNQGKYQSSISIKGNNNFVIMGGKGSKVNFH